MNFEKYYNGQFKSDIQKFFMTIPDESRFHDDCGLKQIFSVQYGRLTSEHNHLNFLTTNKDKIYFGIALFFTILVDEVYYTYYKNSYEKFRQLTNYPKFIGNCERWCRHNYRSNPFFQEKYSSWCDYHLHPSAIFLAMNEDKSSLSNDYLKFYDTFFEAIAIMEREIKDFFYVYIPTIDKQEFWNRCTSEFPFKPIEKKK